MIFKTFAFLLFVFGMACADWDTAAKEAFQQQMLTEHNLVRQKTESGMSNLVWSETLEGYAQEWADNCVFKHRNGTDLRSKKSGENIFAAWRYNMATIGRTAAKAWASEKSRYFHETNKCLPKGKACGHYTAMVWATTKEVGCAFTYCESNKGMQIVVCNYSPPGNFRGRKPY
ncbi:uncharacterized protein LOC135501819 [Lineus longissimus]|uniref:uncharacterized protein LOC135501819 n=1 Tax=Lineus longissimus TaxID=88925 RepID=UPI00315D2CB7